MATSTPVVARVPSSAVNAAAVEQPVRARLGRWPHQPDVAHLVLLDHQMVPTPNHVAGWIRDARRLGCRAIRTGALFPTALRAFTDAGFDTIDTLVLMECDLTGRSAVANPASVRLRRLRRGQLAAAAAVDQAAFDFPWGNDEQALSDITDATPQFRARHVVDDGRSIGFAISGRAGVAGYVQRLAIHPEHQGRGLGALLLGDSLSWMARRRVRRALVNTAENNHRALDLYGRFGFRRRTDNLQIVELGLGTAAEAPPGHGRHDRPRESRHG